MYPTSNGHTYTTKSGVILNLYKVKQTIVRQAAMVFQPPEVPKVFLEEKSRYEENPNDPSYIANLRKYNLDMGTAGTNAYLMLGTSPKFIPEDIAPMTDEWDEDLKLLGIVVATGGKARYKDWLRYVVLEDDEEMFDLVAEVMKYCGVVKEEDVIAAEATFRGDKEWVPDQEVSVT